MYLGASPYSSTLYNGPAMPRYDLPFSGGSAYTYSYGSRFHVGSPGPYGPIHLSGPPPYSGGSMMGAGIFLFFFGAMHRNWSIFLSPTYSCIKPIV